jgi:DNA mismatch endonuclease (patch repair protein)
MADIFTPQKRSQIMRSVGTKNTSPELFLHKALRKLGIGFTKHAKLPGSPDVIIRSQKRAIFVHGCFWHGHKGCARSKKPKTNKIFWLKKINANILRDKRNLKDLRALGWKPIVVWGCDFKSHKKDKLVLRIKKFLSK